MAKFILHIGLHKTGSSSIQRFLSANDVLLLKKWGILYPETGRDAIHQYHHEVFRALVDNGVPDVDIIELILAEAKEKGAEKILISTEILSRVNLQDEFYRNLAAIFSGHSLQIIIYLREQTGWLVSAYAERIKRGYVAAPSNINDIRVRLNYFDYLESLSAVFGQENIFVRIFEKAVMKGLYEDFLRVLGVSDSRDFMTVPSSNERLPWLYLACLRYANKNLFARRVLSNWRMKRVAQLAHKRFPNIMDFGKPLTENGAAEIKQRYHESNIQLSKKYLRIDSENPFAADLS